MSVDYTRYFSKQLEKIARNDPNFKYFSNIRIWTDSLELPPFPVKLLSSSENYHRTHYYMNYKVELFSEKDFSNLIKGIENSSSLVQLELCMADITSRTDILLKALSKNKSIRRLCLHFYDKDTQNEEKILKSLYKHPNLESLHINFPKYINQKNESFETLVKNLLLNGFISLKNFYIFKNSSIVERQYPPYQYQSYQSGGLNCRDMFNSFTDYNNNNFLEKIYNRNLTLKFDIEDLNYKLSLIRDRYNIPNEILDIIYGYVYHTLLHSF